MYMILNMVKIRKFSLLETYIYIFTCLFFNFSNKKGLFGYIFIIFIIMIFFIKKKYLNILYNNKLIISNSIILYIYIFWNEIFNFFTCIKELKNIMHILYI